MFLNFASLSRLELNGPASSSPEFVEPVKHQRAIVALENNVAIVQATAITVYAGQ